MKSKIEEMKEAISGRKIGEEVKKLLSKLCIKYKINKGEAFLVEQELEGQELLHLCIMKSDKNRLSINNSTNELLKSDFIEVVNTINGNFERFKTSLDIQGQRNEDILKEETTAIRDSIIFTGGGTSIIVKALKGSQFHLSQITFKKINEMEISNKASNTPTNTRKKLN